MPSIAELDDTEDTVYFIGVDFANYTDEDVKSLMEAFDRHFDNAEFVVIDREMEGDISIEEMDKEDIRDVIDYNNVMKNLYDDYDYEVTDD